MSTTKSNPVSPELEEEKQQARNAVLEAADAAEQFRQDFKDFLDQFMDPVSWKDGLKLLVKGGTGLAKDFEQLLVKHDWAPDQLVLAMHENMDGLVQKHPELSTQWEGVKVSFSFAKLQSDRALAQCKKVAKMEYKKFDRSEIAKAIWEGVKEELKKDMKRLT